jgi:1-acyl-sn-glycerol-3-phosphate acyltransferase
MNRHLEVPHPLVYRAISYGTAPYLYAKGMDYTGAENIPEPGTPHIVCAVHRTTPDILAVARIWMKERGASIHFAAAKDMLDDPKNQRRGLSALLKHVGAIPIERTGLAAGAEFANRSLDVLGQNGILGIFPEHNSHMIRGNEVQLDKVKGYLCFVASKASFLMKQGVKIVTVGIAGTESDNIAKINVHIGQSVTPTEFGLDFERRRSIPSAAREMFPFMSQAFLEAQRIAVEQRGLRIN